MPPRGEKKRYEEVLSVAGEIFAEKGYESTSTQDIADRLGILKGSLYYYTESKENLLFELIEETLQGSLANLEGVFAEEATAIERLRNLIRVHIRYLSENLVGTTLSLHERRSLSAPHREVVKKIEETYYDGIRKIVKDGQKDGSIRADLDPRIVTLGILGTINWPYRWYRRRRGVSNPKTIGDQFAVLLTDGLEPSKGN